MLKECGFGSEATVLAVVENALQRLAKELASQLVQGVGEHNAFMQDWICPQQVREAVREGF